MIHGNIDHSVLSYNVQVGYGSTIKDSVIMPNVTIGENVHIERSIIASNCVIEDGAVVGNSAVNSEITLIGENQTITNPNKKKITLN